MRGVRCARPMPAESALRGKAKQGPTGEPRRDPSPATPATPARSPARAPDNPPKLSASAAPELNQVKKALDVKPTSRGRRPTGVFLDASRAAANEDLFDLRWSHVSFHSPSRSPTPYPD